MGKGLGVLVCRRRKTYRTRLPRIRTLYGVRTACKDAGSHQRKPEKGVRAIGPRREAKVSPETQTAREGLRQPSPAKTSSANALLLS